MLNEWVPTTSGINLQVLAELAALGQQIQHAEHNLNALTSKTLQQQAQPWLRLSEQDWLASIEQLDPAQLLPLARFFTLAEKQLSGWNCGSKNPAIWIFRWLRKHQQQPSKAEVQQLKQLTDNKFIPYGSAL